MTHASLARKLRILRAARGITLAEAEELTGVTRETLGALEHGQRGAYTSTLEKIARGYGVTVSALLSEVEEPEAELALAGSSPKDEAPDQEWQQFEDELIAMTPYGHGETSEDEAWAWAREQVEEARRFYEGPFTVRDDGESVKVFVRRGATARIGAAHDRAIRDEVRRANALDRERGRV
jgi:transcriptional regulator with XRE-family HTH domain